ncbi:MULTISPECIES: lipopolysaccharide biosynthesis protein [Dermacoccus]|uniref:Lipopolysaccharide biosynthesis protein n=2 Tax=Dermacoccus TaxID=57495 RepID=A0A417Z5A4_9MICO|nr:lipopolysaccharide biosynthesis protein [Dermacoccus abyssi]RHW45893.1 lipopolysaccharide biosynthesis protein [Dermacoccus abyssi]
MKAAKYLLGAQWGRYLLQIANLAVLARLLNPADFGLVAVATALTGFAWVLGDFGLSLAALQAPRLTQAEKSNLFWLNTAMGLGLAVLVPLCSFPLAMLFGDERLVGIILCMAPAFFLRGAAVQFGVEMNRNSQFGRLAGARFLGDLIGFVGTLVLALCGFGYFALALNVTIAALAGLVTHVAWAGWRPGWPRRDVSVGGMVRFGWHTMIAQLANYVTTNADTLAIGKFFGPVPVGYYNRATQMSSMAVQQVAAPLTAIVVPKVAGAAQEGAAATLLRRYHILLAYPLTAFSSALAALSLPAVNLVLGPGWEMSATFITILCLSSAFQAVGYVYYWGFVSTAQTRLLAQSELISRSIMLVVLIACAAFGDPYWVAWSVVFGQWLLWIVSGAIYFPRAGLPAAPYIETALRCMAIGLVALGLVRLVATTMASREGDPIALVILGSVWLLGYGLAWRVLGADDRSTVKEFAAHFASRNRLASKLYRLV